MWREIFIKGEVTNYIINETGIVFNIKKILKQTPDKDGYLRVGIIHKGKVYTKKVHRLVAEAFVPIRFVEEDIVHHEDCVKQHNCYKNLDWTTAIKNSNKAREDGLYRKGKNHQNSIYSEKQIIEVCVLLSNGVSVKKTSKITDVDKGTVYGIKYKKAWNHISNKYNFGKTIKMEDYSNLHKEIDSMILKGFKTSDILSKLDLKRFGKKAYTLINYRRKKRRGSTTIESSFDIETDDVFFVRVY